MSLCVLLCFRYIDLIPFAFSAMPLELVCGCRKRNSIWPFEGEFSQLGWNSGNEKNDCEKEVTKYFSFEFIWNGFFVIFFSFFSCEKTTAATENFLCRLIFKTRHELRLSFHSSKAWCDDDPNFDYAKASPKIYEIFSLIIYNFFL